MSRQGGVGALFETHPAAASNKDKVLHRAGWNAARPHGEVIGRDVAMQELDAKADGR